MAQTGTPRPGAPPQVGNTGGGRRRPGSFRTRIALWTALACGVVLAGFGLSAWLLVRGVSLQRLDGELVRRGHNHLTSPGPRNWDGLVRSLEALYGERSQGAVVLLVKDQEGDVVYRSAQWPEALPGASFPTPSAAAATVPWRPPGMRGGFRGGRGNGPTHFTPPPLPDQPPPGDPDAPPDVKGPGPVELVRPPMLLTRHVAGRTWRLGVLGDEANVLVLGLALDAFAPELVQTGQALLTAVPVALVLIGILAWLISDRALRPLREVTQIAETITAQDLSRRIPQADEDAEFVRLSSVFNAMLERLERSFHQATRFSADAAHELKTPLTILQGQLEEALQHAEPGSDAQEGYAELLEEVQRLKSIVRHLLLLSLADSGQLSPDLQPLNLTEVVEGLVEDVEVMAPDLAVTAELASGVSVQADPALLMQALLNLASNAVKYNREGGSVHFTLEQAGDVVRLSVTNTGPGILEQDRERVFDRFYRADPSRSREVEGAGLGLGLAREIARAHGGDLTLAPGAEDRTTFVLTLPASG